MNALTLYPAIDLLGGQVVRLERGERATATVYSEDAGAVAEAFVADGAEWLHVIDLDAAFDGARARQVEALARIVARSKDRPIQLGGGLRDLASIEAAMNAGVQRVLLGTAAVEHRDVLRRALAKWGATRVAVAVDEKDGFVKTRGWTEGAPGLRADAFARDLVREGVRVFLHSSISRDGTMAGPDLDALRVMAGAVSGAGGEVICAGGVSALPDLRTLKSARIQGVSGVVAGRAIYEKAFTVADAVRTLRGDAA